jgi:ankyrin
MRKLIVAPILLAILLAFCPILFAAEIHEAAKNGDIAKLNELLQKDPSLLYLKDEMGKTPLHWATGRTQLEAMKLLLDTYKVDVNVRNDNQGTPLHVAASQANPEGVKILLDHGADINARTKDNATPLHFAAFKVKPGHLEALKILIDNGADVNAKMKNGATPLALAQMMGNTEAVNILRQHGAIAGTTGGRRGISQRQGPMDISTPQD